MAQASASDSALLISGHPEKIQDVGCNHGVAEKNSGSSGRQQLIDPPAQERGRQQQTPQQRVSRRLERKLHQRKAGSGEQQRQRAEPSVHLRRHELVRQQKDACGND